MGSRKLQGKLDEMCGGGGSGGRTNKGLAFSGGEELILLII